MHTRLATRWCLSGLFTLVFTGCPADEPVEGDTTKADTTQADTTQAATTVDDPTVVDPGTSTSPDDPTSTGSTAPDPDTTTGTTDTTDTSTSTTEPLACTPSSNKPCYDGPPGTQFVDPCQLGMQTCLPDGSGYGECIGQVLPTDEDCATPIDENCDGEANEPAAGCVCAPADEEPCYDGDAATQDVGICHGGTRVCDPDGLGFGACDGQVLPLTEDCATPDDDDCDGAMNEDCACTPGDEMACGTTDVGACSLGVQTCEPDGLGYGDCVGAIDPLPAESCATPDDDDCDGMTNEGCVCDPGDEMVCGTTDVGACQLGTATCKADGTGFDDCVGAIDPQPAESCATPEDDDCDGATNEGCVCVPNSVQSCYTGPAGTAGVGICKAGSRTCNAQGTGYGPCTGEITPEPADSCTTDADDDCDGMTNEGCPVVTWSGDASPIFQAKCAPCHTTGGSGGANFATNYAQSQLASYSCNGLTKGACTIVRIQNGSMPLGKGCTGNPVNDAANPACLTAAEQSTLQAWIAGGQLP